MPLEVQWMDIKVKLFATLRDGRGKEIDLKLEDGTDAQKVIEVLNIQEEDVAILLINGRHGTLDRKLADRDTVSIFPAVGGG